MENTKTLRQKLARGLTALIVPIVAGCATSTSDYLGALSWKTYSGMAKRPGTRIMSGLIGETMAFEAQKEAMKEAAREGVDYERRTKNNDKVYNNQRQQTEYSAPSYELFTFRDLNKDKRPNDMELSNEFSEGEIISVFFKYKNLLPGQNIRFLLRRENGSINTFKETDYINEYNSASKMFKFICEKEHIGYNEIKAIVNNKFVKYYNFFVMDINK